MKRERKKKGVSGETNRDRQTEKQIDRERDR